MTTPQNPLGAFGAPYGIPADINGQGFDEHRWAQLTEANNANVQAITQLTARLDTVRDAVGSLAADLQSAGVRLDTHSQSLIELASRVAELEEKDQPPAKPIDEMNQQILEFLNSHADLKFTAIAIRENLGLPTKYIHDRCKTLVRQGKIRAFTEANRHPFYQALERNPDLGVSQPI